MQEDGQPVVETRLDAIHRLAGETGLTAKQVEHWIDGARKKVRRRRTPTTAPLRRPEQAAIPPP
eukprot:SAG11_NODE_25511_length_358_cov_0.447876_1_plen_63_part_01